MKDDTDDLIYLAAGPAAALLLGIALIPFRAWTSASNLTFAFMALTIAASELGGRRVALATAITSGLSLNFFLTKPYLTLRIADKHDVVAFVGLTACGLVAAAFGSHRERRKAERRTLETRLELLHAAIRSLETAERAEIALVRVLDRAAEAFSLSGVVLRGIDGGIVSASGRGISGLPASESADPERYPSEGVRVALVASGKRVGSLDVWGDGAEVDPASRRLLRDIGLLVAFVMAKRP